MSAAFFLNSLLQLPQGGPPGPGLHRGQRVLPMWQDRAYRPQLPRRRISRKRRSLLTKGNGREGVLYLRQSWAHTGPLPKSNVLSVRLSNLLLDLCLPDLQFSTDMVMTCGSAHIILSMLKPFFLTNYFPGLDSCCELIELTTESTANTLWLAINFLLVNPRGHSPRRRGMHLRLLEMNTSKSPIPDSRLQLGEKSQCWTIWRVSCIEQRSPSETGWTPPPEFYQALRCDLALLWSRQIHCICVCRQQVQHVRTKTCEQWMAVGESAHEFFYSVLPFRGCSSRHRSC